MSTIAEQIVYAVCPHCDQQAGQVSHLAPGEKAGPWRCDSCGGWYHPSVNDDGTFLIEKDPRPKEHRTLVFLRRGDVLLVLHEWTYDGKLNQQQSLYFYNEHTCPTNYLCNVVAIVDLKTGNPDPHGVFTYEGSLSAKEAQDEDTAGHFVENNWQALWAQAKQNVGVLTS